MTALAALVLASFVTFVVYVVRTPDEEVSIQSGLGRAGHSADVKLIASVLFVVSSLALAGLTILLT